MPVIVARGENVYKCDTCKRNTRVPQNIYGLDVIFGCIITQGCKGQLHKVKLLADANKVGAITPEVTGLTDWIQKELLFNFTQNISSTKWTIQHNLNTIPVVYPYSVTTVNKQQVQTSIPYKTLSIIDFNTVQITFDTAVSGIAQCVALASARTTNPTTVALPSTMQLTGDGSISIATSNLAPYITFSILYNSTVPTSVAYTDVGAFSDVTSPWSNVSQVFVNGKTFYVRNFNLKTHPSAADAFKSGAIVDASEFQFQGLSAGINRNIILLANTPFTTADRNLNQYIDINMISTTQPQTYYYQGNAYTLISVIKDVYPPILPVV